MASTIRDYSATAASNTTVDGADISEGCSPAGINDAIRGVMADLKDVSTGAVSLESPAADSLSLSGALTTTSTIDGRDVSADGSKLDGIEAGATADQTGAEIKAAYEAEANAFTDAQFTKLAGIEASADVTDTANVTAAGALMDSEVTNLAQVKAFDSADYATAAQGTTADAALPRSGGAMTGAITTNSTFDGRDVATDGAKLDGIEASADVTDAGNVNPLVDAHLNTSTASASEVLSWTGTDYDWVAQSGGGGADLYAANESSPAAQPSATGGNAIAIGDSAVSSGDDAVALGVSRAGGDHSFAAVIANGTSSYGAIGNYSIAIGFQAKASNWGGAAFGKGATTAGSNYNVAIGNSYTSGADAFSAAIANNTAIYGATGANSVAMGYRSKANGSYGFAVGYQNIASGSYSAALGRNTTSAGAQGFAAGYLSEAAAVNSTAFGFRSKTRIEGQLAVTSGYFGAAGDAQSSIYTFRSDTTDAIAEALTTDNSTASTDNQIILPNNSAYSFHGTIVARESAASGTDCAAWKVEGLIRREGSAGTTVLVNSATTVLDNTPSWGMALSADTTNGGLKVEVTGAAATNIRWVGTIHTSEVIYS